MLCTWPDPFLGTVLQNKIFDYMAASRPIVAAVHGELAALVETADCGWVVTPGAPDALARVCLELASTDPDVLRRKGANGRAYVERHYRRSHLADRALAAATAAMHPLRTRRLITRSNHDKSSPRARPGTGHARSRSRSVQPRHLADKAQRTVLVMVTAAIVTAVAAPYPMTKVILGGTLAVYWATSCSISTSVSSVSSSCSFRRSCSRRSRRSASQG